MEMFWLIALGVCWVLGTILTYCDVLGDEETVSSIRETTEAIKNSSSIFLMLRYYLTISIICALWPIWKIDDLMAMLINALKKEEQ